MNAEQCWVPTIVTLLPPLFSCLLVLPGPFLEASVVTNSLLVVPLFLVLFVKTMIHVYVNPRCPKKGFIYTCLGIKCPAFFCHLFVRSIANQTLGDGTSNYK